MPLLPYLIVYRNGNYDTFDFRFEDLRNKSANKEMKVLTR